jgi:serine/threonine protein kinase/tetratricopeptide (TPR) repeat protein
MSTSESPAELIFFAAMERDSPEQRARYVEEACAGDAALRARVERLLAAQPKVGSFLESPSVADLADLADLAAVEDVVDASAPGAAASERPGTAIGPYKLLQQIGEGGFGTVYMAEQEHPVRRRVALKIIKPGMDTKQVIARFEAERQALAMMEHAGIARVFDAGATANGRPYFVMELVRGEPITEFCDKNILSIPRRLELFAQVCHAVQHAHQKGLIHRDLKPSNVMVSMQDDRPVAKVIDFGIAKATQARLTEKTLFTEFKQLIGTPQYMSPEQAGGDLDIDTRSDVYSLGVLLYELLTGTTPFTAKELRSKAYAEIRRIICEVEPPRPSTRLSHNTDTLASVAAHRQTEPRKLSASVRGELDWIVMKCLEKDRGRRYESASGLAIDVQRHLHNEPVAAGPPSRLYRVRKFVRRNRAAVIGAALITLLLIGGITGTTIGLVEARKQRDQSQRQAEEARRQTAVAEAVSKFQSDMLSSADPSKALGDKVTVLQAVSAAEKELDAGKLKDQPVVEAKVRDTIGNTLRDLGRFDLAEPNLRKGLELRIRSLPPGSRPIAQSMENLALVLHWQRKFAESESMHREALRIFRALDPPDEENVATALNNLAWLMAAQGNYAEEEKLVREALAIYRKILPPDHAFIPLGLNNVAHALIMQGKLAEAKPVALEALSAVRKSLPAGHPNIGGALTAVAGVLGRQDRDAEAEPYSREALEIFRRSLPPDHPNVATAANSLGLTLRAQGKLAEAEPLLREAAEIRRKSLPDSDPDTANSLHNLALVLSEQGKHAEAEPVFADAIAAARRAAGDESLVLGYIRLGHGNALARAKRYADAERELLEAQRIYASAPAAPAQRRAEIVRALASLYDSWERSEPGEGHAAKAAEWKAKLPTTQPTTTATTRSLLPG